MASGAGKAAQPPGPGSAVNGTAAEFPNIEQELYDYQMHSKMCKKIAQLTKVIYSLNTKNEEQEAALQALNYAHQEELHRIIMETCHEGEESVLRTRLLQLQDSLDEQQRVGAQVQADFESFRAQAEEREREAEAELRKGFEERLQAAEEELQQAKAQLSAAQDESLQLGKELENVGVQVQDLEVQCERLQKAAEEERKREEEEKKKGEEERKSEEQDERVKALLEEVNAMKEERDRAEEEKRKALKEEREGWERKMSALKDEKEEMRKRMDAERREERRRWGLERLDDSKRNTQLQERIQDLEEELELGRRCVSEAESGAKRAEEELAVAKERLLLQEDELQSRAEELLSRGGCEVCVCAEVEELRNQVSRLQSRNRELELQSSGRNNDHARQIRQHSEALSSLRSEMVRAQAEELRRVQKHADDERDKLQKEIEKERESLQKDREQEKDQLEKERNRLHKERDEEKEALHKETEEAKERLRKEKDEEVERLRKEIGVEKVRVRSQLEGNKEQVEVEKASLQQKLEEEKKRLVEKAEEDRKQLKEQVRRAIEEVMRRHAAELQNAQEALSSEKKTNQEVCVRLEEERRGSEEVCRGLKREREHLRMKLQDATKEICRLESVIQRQEKMVPEAPPTCRPQCSHLEDELHQTQSRLARIQEEGERQRERQQREITSLRADKHRLEEKVLEQSRLNTERSLLEQSQRHTEDRIRAECEDRLRAEFRIELNAAVAEGEQRYQNREQELQSQLADLQSQLSQAEKKRTGLVDDCHGNPEIDRLRKEVQDTKEINKKMREQLQEPQAQTLVEERHNHAMALQALERQSKEDLLSERNRLQTLHHLQLDKQRAELTQQHTEWSRQVTQRHMQQIEDLQAELQTHTQMMALQQDLKQQNQWQVFERQLDESRCAVLELQRENVALREQLKERVIHEESEVEEKEEEKMSETLKTRDAQLEEEAQHLKEEVEKLRVEMEKLEESQKHWEEKKEEDTKEEGEERRKERQEEKRKEEVEEIRREHKKEMQNLVSEYSSAQTHLQARIVALEKELREREERCRRKEPRCDDLQLGTLQERLTEREQLIKRLVEERHQLQLHPPVAGDNSTLRLRDNKSRPGSVTPTMRRKRLEESPPHVTSIPSGGAYDRSLFLPHSSSSSPSSSSSSSVHQHSSSTLPHPPTSHPQASPHYSTSSLPHKHTSLSLSQHSSPSLPRSARSRTSCTPPTPAPTAPLPVCPSPQTGIRYVSPCSQEPRLHLQAPPVRGPYLEQRGTEGLKQQWFTKYFSF
ncbi:LOW QUALITY PROTEIN: protein FAM184B [Diretmus argenteus]